MRNHNNVLAAHGDFADNWLGSEWRARGRKATARVTKAV